MSGDHRERPVTMGRTFGLGRAGMPQPRQHCKRCAEIVDRADQMVSNYVIANGRQVDIINRLLHEDSNATKEVIRLGQLVAERDAFLEHLYNDARSDTDEGYALRNAIELFWKEVNGGEGTDS